MLTLGSRLSSCPSIFLSRGLSPANEEGVEEAKQLSQHSIKGKLLLSVREEEPWALKLRGTGQDLLATMRM